MQQAPVGAEIAANDPGSASCMKLRQQKLTAVTGSLLFPPPRGDDLLLNERRQPILAFGSLNVVILTTILLGHHLRTIVSALFVTMALATGFAVLRLAWRLNKD